MPKADPNNTPSRRRFLVVAAGAVAAGAGIAAKAAQPANSLEHSIAPDAFGAVPAAGSTAVAAGPDAALITTCNRFVAIWIELAELARIDGWAPDHGPLHNRYEALVAEQHPIADWLQTEPEPTTRAGAQAMAQAALVMTPRDFHGVLQPAARGEFHMPLLKWVAVTDPFGDSLLAASA